MKTKKQKAKSSKGITAEWFKLDEKTCREMLSLVPDIQRGLKQGNMNKIYRDLSHGEWRDTGVPIIISDKGMLIDGQHRLNAFLKSGVFPEVLIVRNVTHDMGYKSIDTGQSRTFGDVFKSQGIPEYTKCATICSRLIRCQNKTLHVKSFSYSAQDLLTIYSDYEESIKFWKCKHSELNMLCSQPLRAGISCYVEQYISRSTIVDFWDQMKIGIGSGGALALRRCLMKNANKSRGKYQNDEVAYLILEALHMHKNGLKQKQLSITKMPRYFH